MAKDLIKVLDKSLNKKSTTGSLLKAFRKSLDLTQDDLVKITGIQRPNISKLENDAPMTSYYAEIFAAAFGIHPSTLLYPEGRFEKKGDLLKVERRAKALIKKKRA